VWDWRPLRREVSGKAKNKEVGFFWGDMLIGDNYLLARKVGEDKHYIDNLCVSIG